MKEEDVLKSIVVDSLTWLFWLIFFTLLGCVVILGPSTVSVDNSVKRPVISAPDTADDIDWIEWDK